MQSCYHSVIPDLRHHVTSCFMCLLPCALTVTDWGGRTNHPSVVSQQCILSQKQKSSSCSVCDWPGTSGTDAVWLRIYGNIPSHKQLPPILWGVQMLDKNLKCFHFRIAIYQGFPKYVTLFLTDWKWTSVSTVSRLFNSNVGKENSCLWGTHAHICSYDFKSILLNFTILCA